MKRILKSFWRVLVALSLTEVILFVALMVYTFAIDPYLRCQSLRHRLFTALDHAFSVTIVEHSSQWDIIDRESDRVPFKETVYSTIVLTPVQTASFRNALPFSADYSGTTALACIFDSHHRVEIKETDGTVFVLQICFQCGELLVDEEHQRIMPKGWHASLGAFVSSIGLHPQGTWKKLMEP